MNPLSKALTYATLMSVLAPAQAQAQDSKFLTDPQTGRRFWAHSIDRDSLGFYARIDQEGKVIPLELPNSELDKPEVYDISIDEGYERDGNPSYFKFSPVNPPSLLGEVHIVHMTDSGKVTSEIRKGESLNSKCEGRYYVPSFEGLASKCPIAPDRLKILQAIADKSRALYFSSRTGNRGK